MPDIPEAAITAAAEAILTAQNANDDEPERWEARHLASVALEAAAPILAEAWKPTSGLDADAVTVKAVKHLNAADAEIARLREHIDTDHGAMVQLGIIADSAVKMLEHINMDTAEDRELHARATGALRGRLSELAATMKEASEVASGEH